MTVHPPELVGRQVGCSWRAVAACSSMAKLGKMHGGDDEGHQVGCGTTAPCHMKARTPLILVQKVVDVDCGNN